MRVDHRHVFKAAGMSEDGIGIVSRIHQLIEPGDALRAHGHQGDRHVAVMHVGSGQNGADGDLAVRHIEVQLDAQGAAGGQSRSMCSSD
jgi:NAD(P)H-hydrate repair Nnr-like enzyme with NAD(P)H-hydrate epimerase domain